MKLLGTDANQVNSFVRICQKHNLKNESNWNHSDTVASISCTS